MTRDELRLRLDGHLANADASSLLMDLQEHADLFGPVKEKTGFAFGKKPPLPKDDFEIDFEAPPRPELRTPVHYAAQAVKQGLGTPADILPAIKPALAAMIEAMPGNLHLFKDVENVCSSPELADKSGFLSHLEQQWPDKAGPRVFSMVNNRYHDLDIACQRDVAPFVVRGYVGLDLNDPTRTSKRDQMENLVPGNINKFLKTSEHAADNPDRLRAVISTAEFYSHAGFMAAQTPSLKPRDIEPTLKQLGNIGRRLNPDGEVYKTETPAELGAKFAEMNATLSRHLVLPAYCNADVAKQTGADAFTNVDGYREKAIETTKKLFWATTPAQEAVSPQRTLTMLQRFERNEGVLHGSLPDTHLGNMKWEKLHEETVTTANGCTIEFLSSKDEINETARRYHNCMAGKLQDYLYNNEHVMLITSPDGQQAAAQVKSDNAYRSLKVTETPKMPLSEGADYVRAHQGCWVPELKEGFSQFQDQVATGELKIDFDRIERSTNERKNVKQSNSSKLAIACGYDIEKPVDRDAVMATYSQRMFSGGDYKRMGGIDSYDAFLAKTGLGEIARQDVSRSLMAQNKIEIAGFNANPDTLPELNRHVQVGGTRA